MKKILVISNTTFSIQKFRLHYLSKIDQYFFKIYTPKDNLFIKSKSKNIEHSHFYSENFISSFVSIFQILKKEKARTIIVYSTYYIFILSILKLLFNFNLITVVAGRGSLFFEIFTFKERILRKIFTFILNFSNKIIFINPGDFKYFTQNSNIKEKSFIIPTEGVQKIKFDVKINNKKNFIFFARLINEKGLLDFIELSKRVKKKYPFCNFFIAGPISKNILGQSSLPNIKYILEKNKKCINYLGYIKNYKKIFPKMDCLVAPSKLEGAGTSVMEAMQSGLFVIAYSNTGHNYVLKKTDNIICNKNNVDSLFNAVEKFLNLNQKKIKQIAKKSYNKIIEKYESENISNKFLSIINHSALIKKNKILSAAQAKTKVAIILCTYNGEDWIDQQIKSILMQNNVIPDIFISDDNSSDSTFEILKKLKKKNKNIIKIYRVNFNSPNKNFLYLLKKVYGKYDFYAFCDQDDIWHPDKIITAVNKLKKNNYELYGSRSTIIDENERIISKSIYFKKEFRFENSLVQNFAGGNTLVMSKRLVKEFLSYKINDAPSYDWIIYIFATFKKFRIFYDINPKIFYRQHEGNFIGSNLGFSNQLKRIVWTFKGRFKEWNNFHEKIINKFYSSGDKNAQKNFKLFQKCRVSNIVFIKHLVLKKFPFYRQTFLSNIFLKICLMFKLL